jgi:hypothetical protein
MVDIKAVGVVVDNLQKEKGGLQAKQKSLQAQLEAIQAEMNSLKDQIDDLDVTIKVLDRHHQIPQGESRSSPKKAPSPSEQIPPGVYEGHSWVGGTKKLLEEVGKPLKTPIILKRLKEGGLQVGGARPYTALYSALRKSKHFELTKRGWALKAREDNAVPK